MPNNYGPKIVTDGMTLCLDAANTKSYLGSGTVWTDLSRNGNNGTLNGSVFNSANMGSIVFDGTDDYVAIPSSSLVSGSQMTFSLWNFGVSGQTANSVVYFRGSSGQRILNVHLTWYDTFVIFDAGNGSGNVGQYDRVMKEIVLADVQGWNYWTFTKNSALGRMRIYKNGKLWLAEMPPDYDFGPVSASIGAASTGSLGGVLSEGFYYSGRIASAKLYSRELSESEILQNYNATKGRFKL